MARTSARNRLVDTLLDPMAAAILASIGLHASIGASLPYFLQPLKTGVNNPGTDTVKVVELTPDELQRIPQIAPQPEPAPAATPAPQATTPTNTAKPTPTARPQPSTSKFGTAPLRIPFTPIPAGGATVPVPATTPAVPTRNQPTRAKPSRPAKSTQAATTIVDPDDFFPDPKTTTQPAAPKGNKIRPTTHPSPAISTAPTQSKSPSRKTTNPARDDRNATDNREDSGTTKPQATPATAPSRNNPTGNGSPSGQPGTKPSSQSTGATGDPKGTNTGNSNSGGFPAAMQTKLNEYRAKYPGLQVYRSSAQPAYPPNVAKCLQGQPSVYVMVVFDKFPDGKDANVLGAITANPIADPPFVKGDAAILTNPALKDRAVIAGLEIATAKDSNRPIADRNRQVVYINRVTLDPSTCK